MKVLLFTLLLKADVDGSGTIDCEEFITLSIHLKRIGSDETLFQAFTFFDKNQNGYIEFDELRESMLEDNLGPNNDKVIQDIMFDVDLDKVIQRNILLYNTILSLPGLLFSTNYIMFIFTGW